MKWLLSLMLLVSFSSYALEVPRLTRPVEDLAKVLNEQQKSDIETSIKELYKSGLAQVSVLIIPSLEGENLEEYSIKVAETWKLGSAEKDNGVLLLISMNDRKIRVEVGNGIEGELTDYQSSKIIDGMKSYMRSKQFDQGILYAVDGVKNAMSGQEVKEPETKKRGGNMVLLVIILAIIAFGLLILLDDGSGIGGGGSGGGWSGGGWSGGGGGFSGGGSSGGW